MILQFARLLDSVFANPARALLVICLADITADASHTAVVVKVVAGDAGVTTGGLPFLVVGRRTSFCVVDACGCKAAGAGAFEAGDALVGNTFPLMAVTTVGGGSICAWLGGGSVVSFGAVDGPGFGTNTPIGVSSGGVIGGGVVNGSTL